jgi:Na+-translocating ferredoxin:NAD+ oxidoreductase RnfD subunit
MSDGATIGPRRIAAALGEGIRGPKGTLILVLGLLAAIGGVNNGLSVVAPGFSAAVLVAIAIDAPIIRVTKGRWEFPSGALLTGMIVAMILSPRAPWYVAAATAGFAVISKLLFRGHTANIFNPAALALVASFYVFSSGQEWWGALPGMGPSVITLLMAGVFVADRVNKLPLVLGFLGGYFALFTVAAFVGDPREVAEVFRVPDLQVALFFAFFMVTDPPTSPPRHRDQWVFGLIVAIAAFAIFEWIGAVHFLLSGLLVANIWEAWRRRSRKSQARHTLDS